MSKRKEIIPDLQKYVIVRKIDDHDCLFAILKSDHDAMYKILLDYRQKQMDVPDDVTVPALRMGKVSEINQFTDGYDIISDTPELETANSLEGMIIKIGNW